VELPGGSIRRIAGVFPSAFWGSQAGLLFQGHGKGALPSPYSTSIFANGRWNDFVLVFLRSGFCHHGTDHHQNFGTVSGTDRGVDATKKKSAKSGKALQGAVLPIPMHFCGDWLVVPLLLCGPDIHLAGNLHVVGGIVGLFWLAIAGKEESLKAWV